MFLLFQIDNLDSDTNQLSSILGATRINIDKLNSTLVNNTLEVGLGMIKTELSKFTYGSIYWRFSNICELDLN